jgi:hypothetical protein
MQPGANSRALARNSALSQHLFREVRPEFFRVLAGAAAAVYVDVLDALEYEAAQRNEGMEREEALAIISRVLSQHPDFQPELAPDVPPETALALPLREKARHVLDHLTRAGWVETQTGADWHRVVFFDSYGTTLLNALRQIAHPEAAVFTDRLVGVCATLANHAEMARQPWEHIQTCRENTQQGLAELRAMQKSVERFIRRQLEAQTLGDNLSVVFDQYAEQMGHTCYAELVRSQLLNRLGDARKNLITLLDDAGLLHKMQAELMRRLPDLDAGAAMSRVRTQLDILERALESIAPMADTIDRRTAEFTRRSLARFRYLQEVVSERRGQIKDLFEHVNRSFAGRRYNDLDETLELPALLLPETRLLAGRDSLYEPPRRRTLEENAPIEDEANDEMRAHTRRQMEGALRDSLSVARANHFLTRLAGGKGARICSTDFPMDTDEDLADVISLLLHAESSDARYRIEVPRITDEDAPIEIIPKRRCRLERFYVIKK